MRFLRACGIGLLFCTAMTLLPAGAAAQGTVGLGPRLTFNRGDASVPGSTALRMLGGQMKFRMSPKTALELALDYHSELSDDLKTRVKDYPFQASLLVYPMSTTIAPYLIGGVGWYSQSIGTLEGAQVEETVTTRKMGYHAGVGAEVRAGRHVTLHGDYRYTFLGMGDDSNGTPGGLPLPGTIGLQERLKLTHQGSMWNWGATFFF
jgi:opacity protein-like surface antigen